MYEFFSAFPSFAGRRGRFTQFFSLKSIYGNLRHAAGRNNFVKNIKILCRYPQNPYLCISVLQDTIILGVDRF